MNYLIDKLKAQPYKQIVSRGTQALLLILIFLIPFSIRHVFDSSWNFQTGAYSDFTSLSIYLSDIVLLMLITLVWISDIHFELSPPLPKLWKWSSILLIGWLIIELFFSTSLPLQIYFSVRFIFLVIFAIALSRIYVPREKIAWLFTILGFIQSLIAIAQFYLQKSLGLYHLGESHLNPTMFGVAKIVSRGASLIRGYGTFPHSNLLAAFLVTSTLFNLYLITKYPQQINRKFHVVALYTTLIANIFGLFITFSRGGIIALIAALLGIFTIFLINKQHSHILKVIVPCGTLIVLTVFVLSPYLSSRATITDASSRDRVFYDYVGQHMIWDKPIAGFGPGVSVLHMKQYMEMLSPVEVPPWDIQPIHNYYIISWAELGIGSIFLLFLIFYPIFLLFKRINTHPDAWEVTLTAILGSFLVLFMIDHYFYTIWPTQLLLWLIIGLIINTSFTWNKPLERK